MAGAAAIKKTVGFEVAETEQVLHHVMNATYELPSALKLVKIFEDLPTTAPAHVIQYIAQARIHLRNAIRDLTEALRWEKSVIATARTVNQILKSGAFPVGKKEREALQYAGRFKQIIRRSLVETENADDILGNVESEWASPFIRGEYQSAETLQERRERPLDLAKKAGGNIILLLHSLEKIREPLEYLIWLEKRAARLRAYYG